MASPVVSAVVTARDEADRIAATVRALLAMPGVRDVVVVDDGSVDDTADRANAAGGRVIRTARRGKGDALEAGLDAMSDTEVFLLADGDLGGTASGLDSVLAAVLEGRADLVVAVLPAPPSGGFGMVKSVAASLVYRASGIRPREPLSGQRAVTRACLWACRPLAAGFGLESAMTADALRLGFRVEEIPAPLEHRFGRKDMAGFAHRGRQGFHVLRALMPRLAGLR